MGRHAGMQPSYIQNSLTFQYAPGAVCNTFESYNGNSFGEIKRRAGSGEDHGLLTEFIKMGGTGGICYPWEPGYNNNIVYGEYFFPAYALGYNLVDAIYQDMPNILFQNVVVGDPLTRIAYPRSTITLTQDSTITSGDFSGRLIVPEGITLRVGAGDTINFKRNASLIVNGSLIIPGAVLNFNGYSNLTYNSGTQITAGTFNFYGYSSLSYNNDQITDGSFNFYNNSYLTAKELNVGSGEHLIFNTKTSLNTESLTISAGAALTFNDESNLNIKNILQAVGTEVNKIRFNSNSSLGLIKIDSASHVELNHNNISNINFE